ncbi:MAG: hypothetical protein PHT60_05895 [Acidiphilium sp.]|nr:hypothetical protein [Acidiphilium sp.]MDD4935297.1 hypothetical protein [Acidiphilium sp.]
MPMKFFAKATFAAAIAAGLSGCTQFEPFERQGTWHENNAPMHNIAVESANPQDLDRGPSQPVMTGQFAQTAVGSVFDSAASTTSASPGSATSGAAATSGGTGATSIGSAGLGSSGTGGGGTSGGGLP